MESYPHGRLFAQQPAANIAVGTDSVTLCNPATLDSCRVSTGHALIEWAGKTPDKVFLAERAPQNHWRKVTYLEATLETRSLALKLLALGCTGERPLAIISENSIDHALIALAAQRIGVPIVPLSMAYATLASDFSRLRYMLDLVTPGAIFVGNPAACRPAIAAISDLAPIISHGNGAVPEVLELSAIAPAVEAEFDAAERLVDADTVAKLMFTSGSTGMPKAVINTQRMLTANQAMLAQVWPIVSVRPPVMVDWLPWSHTFGANFTFNLALFNGGTLHIDAGKPVPALVGATIRNLAEVQPTIYFNVPAGYEAIMAALRENDGLASQVFARMDFAFCAAAALPQTVRDDLQATAMRATGRRLPVLSGWGSTETAPCATATWWDTDRSDNIGLPLPGVELRLAPYGNRRELRVRGPIVTPGYWKNPQATQDAFDAEGFYRMGDAGVLIDENAPERGIRFDGRVAENFKLTSGTWVSVGALRVAVVGEGRPLIRDVIVTGAGRAEIGLLVFVNHAACAALLGDAAGDLTPEEIASHSAVAAELKLAIKRYNGEGRGSSTRVGRFSVLPDAPRIEAYEITDKGYINQSAALANRAAAVEAMYADARCAID